MICDFKFLKIDGLVIINSTTLDKIKKFRQLSQKASLTTCLSSSLSQVITQPWNLFFYFSISLKVSSICATRSFQIMNFSFMNCRFSLISKIMEPNSCAIILQAFFRGTCAKSRLSDFAVNESEFILNEKLPLSMLVMLPEFQLASGLRDTKLDTRVVSLDFLPKTPLYSFKAILHFSFGVCYCESGQVDLRSPVMRDLILLLSRPRFTDCLLTFEERVKGISTVLSLVFLMSSIRLPGLNSLVVFSRSFCTHQSRCSLFFQFLA